jgi:hypothetical protein
VAGGIVGEDARQRRQVAREIAHRAGEIADSLLTFGDARGCTFAGSGAGDLRRSVEGSLPRAERKTGLSRRETAGTAEREAFQRNLACARQLANADADTLMRARGGKACFEARRRECDVILPRRDDEQRAGSGCDGSGLRPVPQAVDQNDLIAAHLALYNETCARLTTHQHKPCPVATPTPG